MLGLPIPLIFSYSILRIFHYSQWLYLREAGSVRSQKFVLFIHLFFLAISAVIVVFLGYWGFKVSWPQAIGLFLSGFVLTMMWQPLWVLMGKRGGDVEWTLLGLVIEPACAFFVWHAVP
jgi:drug/metabolite transporter (DMT)-like permease